MEQTGPFSRAVHPLSPGAGSVIVHEQRVLLVRNRYGVTRGRYLLPAGRVRAGELPDQTAVRETFEETNLPVCSRRPGSCAPIWPRSMMPAFSRVRSCWL